jgi:hypothetical protein
MLPKLHLPVLGPARFPSHWFDCMAWHSSSFGRLCCATPIYSGVARFKPIDILEVAQAAL